MLHFPRPRKLAAYGSVHKSFPRTRLVHLAPPVSISQQPSNVPHVAALGSQWQTRGAAPPLGGQGQDVSNAGSVDENVSPPCTPVSLLGALGIPYNRPANRADFPLVGDEGKPSCRRCIDGGFACQYGTRLSFLAKNAKTVQELPRTVATSSEPSSALRVRILLATWKADKLTTPHSSSYLNCRRPMQVAPSEIQPLRCRTEVHQNLESRLWMRASRTTIATLIWAGRVWETQARHLPMQLLPVLLLPIHRH